MKNSAIPTIDAIENINRPKEALKEEPQEYEIKNHETVNKNVETNRILEDNKQDEKNIEEVKEEQKDLEDNQNIDKNPLHKIGEFLNKIGGKKQEDDDDENDIDQTKNFIAQIYNNKNEASDDETKKIDINEINKKMEELKNAQIQPDYCDFNEMYARTFGTIPKEPKDEEQKEENVQTVDLKTAENVSIFEKLPQNEVPNYKFIGIAFSTYIIIEMGKELYIIDQHAAHERIMYEKIKANYYSDDGEKDSQLMLLPDIINLSHKDMQIAKDNMDIFKKAGFEVDEFGENTIKLSGVPTVCLDLDTKELFLETLDEINTVARTAKQEKEEKFIATVACKAAVKANMALTREEVDNLMRQLLVLPNPFTCPHGRPTAIRMTREDIEKKFSRR